MKIAELVAGEVHDIWSLLGAMIAIVVPLSTAAFVYLEGKSGAKMEAPEDEAKREEFGRKYEVDTSGIDREVMRWAIRQDERLDRVEDRLETAVDAVMEVHDWLDAGMPDPPGRPPRPHWAVKMT